MMASVRSSSFRRTLVKVLLSIALLSVVVFPTQSVSAEPPAGWTHLVLPDVGHDLAIDDARDRVYVSIPWRKTIAVVNATSGAMIKEISVPGRPRGLEISASGDVLYMALNDAGSLGMLDLNLEQTTTVAAGAKLGHPSAWDVYEVDASRVLISANPGSGGLAYIVLINLATGVQTRVANQQIIRAAPAFLRGGANQVVIAEGFSPNSLYRLDLSDPAMPIVAEDNHGNVSGTLAGKASPDGTKLYLYSQVVQASDMQQIGSVNNPGFPAVTPDGTRVAYSTDIEDGSVYVVDANTYNEVATFYSACAQQDVFLNRKLEVNAASDTLYTVAGGLLCADALGPPITTTYALTLNTNVNGTPPPMNWEYTLTGNRPCISAGGASFTSSVTLNASATGGNASQSVQVGALCRLTIVATQMPGFDAGEVRCVVGGVSKRASGVRIDGDADCSVTHEPKMCGGLQVTVDLTAGPYSGTSMDDVILGTSGPETIDGRDGDDTICAMGGADFITGGNGDDVIFAGNGDDEVYGNSGKDRIRGQNGDDIIYGGPGNDNLNGNNGDDQVHGEDGHDYVAGKDGEDTVTGGPGTDTLNGGGKSDVLLGGDGNDTMNGNGFGDEMRGGRGNDMITGGDGPDDLFGESGNDTIVGSRGNDTISGGSGVDICEGRTGWDTASSCETSSGIP